MESAVKYSAVEKMKIPGVSLKAYTLKHQDKTGEEALTNTWLSLASIIIQF